MDKLYPIVILLSKVAREIIVLTVLELENEIILVVICFSCPSIWNFCSLDECDARILPA